MTKTDWIDLLNYSTKYGVSLSTLRRRIKSNAIPYKIEHGKYYLQETRSNKEEALAIPQAPAIPPPTETAFHEASHPGFVEASVLSSANRLVEEIRGAYAKILQEKEEQISQLKEQVVDLKMLVQVLEENAKRTSTQAKEFTQAREPAITDEGDDFLFGDFQSRDI